MSRWKGVEIPEMISDDRLKMYTERLGGDYFNSVEVCYADWHAICAELRARREFMKKLEKIL